MPGNEQWRGWKLPSIPNSRPGLHRNIIFKMQVTDVIAILSLHYFYKQMSGTDFSENWHIESVRSRVKTPPCGRFVNNGGVPDNFQANLVTRGLWQTTEMEQIFQKSKAVVPDITPLNLKWHADCEHWLVKCTQQNSLEQKVSGATY